VRGRSLLPEQADPRGIFRLTTLGLIPSPRIGRYGRVESIGWVLPSVFSGP
jgi:hypothetical protein